MENVREDSPGKKNSVLYSRQKSECKTKARCQQGKKYLKDGLLAKNRQDAGRRRYILKTMIKRGTRLFLYNIFYMSLRTTIFEDQTQAMKARDQEKLSTLRMLVSDIKNAEIEKRQELADIDVQKVVARQAKQLKDAMKDFESGGRADLLEKTKAELAVLSAYLPEEMPDDELEALVRSQIEEMPDADMGKVMGAVMGRVKGRADGSRVRAVVQKLL
jgi:hypothetical protein